MVLRNLCRWLSFQKSHQSTWNFSGTDRTFRRLWDAFSVDMNDWSTVVLLGCCSCSLLYVKVCFRKETRLPLFRLFIFAVFQVAMQACCRRWKQSRKPFYPDKTRLWLRDMYSEVMTPVGKQSTWEDMPVCRSENWKNRGVGSCSFLRALTVNSDLENSSGKKKRKREEKKKQHRETSESPLL